MWQAYLALICLNLPLYFLIATLFFRSLDQFFEAIYFWVRPDFLSAFSGEYWDDLWQEIKLALWVLLCGSITFAETKYWPELIPFLKGLMSAN